MSDADRGIAALAEVVDELRGLRADLAGRRDDERLAPADRAWLARLLPELWRAGDQQWTAADVIAWADGRPVLFALLADYLDKTGTQRLGQRLAACAGKRACDFMLERIGKPGGTVLYCVRSLVGLSPTSPVALASNRR